MDRNEVLKKIGQNLCNINENDMQKAEINIAKILMKLNILKRVEKEFGFIYELVD